MRSFAFTASLLTLLVLHGCSEGRSSSGGGANSSAGGNGGSSSGSDCLGKACGEPCHDCATCDPMSQQICDEAETCQEALEVTCEQ